MIEIDHRPQISPVGSCTGATQPWLRSRGIAAEYGNDPVNNPTAPPHIDGLAVVTCRFDFGGFGAPARNLTRFLRDMDRRGIPVYGIEAIGPGGTLLTEGNPRWTAARLDERYAIWQKEAAINAVVRLLPPEVGAVAIIDADLAFDARDWPALSVAALDRHPAIQPFSEAVWTDRLGRVEMSRPPAAGADKHRSNSWWHHPGFAWVIRRDFWTGGPGLYPYCLTGAGDVVLYVGLACPSADELPVHRVGQHNIHRARDWHAAARRWMGEGTTIAPIPGRIWHEWHGDRANRRYEERHHILANIEIARDIETDSLGLLRWTAAASGTMRTTLAAHFLQRKEDG